MPRGNNRLEYLNSFRIPLLGGLFSSEFKKLQIRSIPESLPAGKAATLWYAYDAPMKF